MTRQRKNLASEPIKVDPLLEAGRSIAYWQRVTGERVEGIAGMLDSLKAEFLWLQEVYADNPMYLADGIVRLTSQFAINAREQILLPAFYLVAAKARLAALQEAAQKELKSEQDNDDHAEERAVFERGIERGLRR